MKIKYALITVLALSVFTCKNNKKTDALDAEIQVSEIKISPIEHATMVIEYNGTTIYVDPTGGNEAFNTFPKADYVLITDIHSDHMHLNTLEALDLKNTTLIAPVAVVQSLPKDIAKTVVNLSNEDAFSASVFSVEAIPMYNLREDALKFHAKGRGNGYVLTIGDELIYISGDTEDIPEMRKLKNIDKAFICMNLPYTMTVESAADAVLDFEPTQVYPYHYRGTEGYSDVEKFKSIVNEKTKDIEVIQLDWYPNVNE
jgi:L-ascorbate metabolism protein UlaG (beta-lactamase superfamily)